ncbi:MAG TPA: ATP-binding protein [Patescibacteria group bacterium]|nr:ATP-binding protein [Patescibacteria group bacterium]
MERDRNQINEVGFNVSARFSQLIGRQLISNPIIAILELVKNAYDADADVIDIKLENIIDGSSRLTISDNGCGMTYEDLTKKWLVVGTNNKVVETRTAKGRRKLGEKGIGRFSVERLAQKAKIITSTLNNEEQIILDIDWSKYEYETQYFNDIKHPITFTKVSNDVTGTTIILEDLRDIWTESLVNELRKELFLLVPLDIGMISPRFKSDVEIKFTCDDYQNTIETINKRFFNYNQARLFGEIYESGDVKLELELRVNQQGSSKESKVKYERFLKKEDINYTCGPVIFEAYVFLRDGRYYRGLELESTQIKNIIDEYSGIKIYRDEFRVKPFGDPGNDWSKLNLRRIASPEYRLSTNQVIGGVKIERDNNPGLQDVLSRENLYDTKEFRDLAEFVNSVFEFYTYASFVEIRSKEKDSRDKREEIYTKVFESSSKLGELVKDNVENIRKQIQTLEKVQQEVEVEVGLEKQKKDQNLQGIEKAIIHAKEEVERLDELAAQVNDNIVILKNEIRVANKFKERELQIYRNIASLGISAAQFGHETEKLIMDSVFAVRRINREPEILNIKNDRLHTDLRNLNQYITSANQKASFFRVFLIKDKQDIEKDLNIIEIFYEVVGSFEKSFADMNINIELNNKLTDDILVKGYYGDFESIITNLVTNAYKALTQGDVEGKFFKLVIEKEEDKLIINSINSGKPIESNDRARIFEPLYTTYKYGTGLGLSIIQDTLKLYNGTIQLVDEYPISNFRIEIPITKGEE